jgi:hypothetical protein
MLFFLFRDEELREIFGRLGYAYDAGTVSRNVTYYDRRTSHGSTLSFVTHAGVLAAIDPESSWERFLVALRSDAEDVQGGTTKEGIHMGVMAGTLDLMQRSYAGTYISDGILCFDPRLPSRLASLSFSMQFRQTPIQLTLTRDRLTLALHAEGGSRSVRVAVRDDVRKLSVGDRTVFELSPATTAPSTPPPRIERRPHAEVPGSDFRRRRSAGRLAAPKGVARVTARADGRRLARHTRPDNVVAGRVHAPRLPAVRVRQAAHGRRPRRPRLLPRARRREARGRVRAAQAGNGRALIEAGDFTAYPDALRFVIATKDAGMRIADASSSKNAGLFLRKIRLDTFAAEHGISSPTLKPGQTLLDYFDVDVSGRDFARGKPDPEIFLTAAHELGVEPRHAMVIEDASSGVQAAKAGGMAALGISRADDADLLAAAGADLVVTSLDDVDRDALARGELTTR